VNEAVVELGDLIEIFDSRRVPLSGLEREQRPGPYPYYGAARIFDYIDDFIFDGDFILIGEDGSVVREDGTPFVQYASGRFWSNNHTHVVQPRSNDVDFWYLKSILERTDISGFVTGAAQPKLNQANLKRIPILLPSQDIQLTIGALARVFHELIENNLRRIEILEEMAQTIYREWFINLRFPGHRRLDFVGSPLGPIPRNWEVRPFSSIASFVNGFAFKPQIHWQATGLPIVKIKELKAGVTSETPRYHGHDVDQKYHVKNGALLFSWSADLDAYLWSGGKALLNQHLFHVLPNDGVEIDFLFHLLKHRMPEFRARAQGTTMKHIKRSALTEVVGVLPDPSTRALFSELVDPVHNLQRNLNSQTRNLRTTRDLLLPKLISGEIDVSELDIDASWLAA
jgi:type I restriction enzyme S subunit